MVTGTLTTRSYRTLNNAHKNVQISFKIFKSSIHNAVSGGKYIAKYGCCC